MNEQVIPEQLQTWRFLLLCPASKIPIAEEKDWDENKETKTFAFNDQQLLKHIEWNGNYGVVTGKDRFVIGADTKEIETAIEARLPKTFTVMSPRHKTKHFYYYGEITKSITCKPSADGDPCADVKHGNAYVLGPGSIFASYGQYEVVDDLPIAKVTEDQVIAAINEFISTKKPKKNKNSKEALKKHPELNFPIKSILPNLEGMPKNGDERKGPHPVHGSTTGTNFKINEVQNVWYCHRHEVGGGPLELLAVLNHIVDCENISKGLRGAQFVQTVKKAEELGLVKDFKFESLNGIEENDIGTLLDKLNNQFTFKTPTDLEDIYSYHNGVYVFAEHEVKAILESWLGARTTTGTVNEVLNHIRRQSFIERSEFNKFKGYIPVQNGLLHLDTEDIKDFDQDNIFTFKLNATFDKTKECPKFLKWLNEVQTSENILTIQEYAGYCLLPSFPFHRSMWFIGKGRNGKGTFVLTLEKILGIENCAHINIQSFNGERNFSEAQLYGKLVNVSSEPTTNKELETPLFKKITGDDYIEAEVKCKQRRLGFRNIAKFFILGNKYPKVNDNTIAFWERIIILPWENTYLEGEGQIQHIENAWLNDPDEVSGILNWMIKGLHRLLDQGHFTVSKTQKQNMIEFKRASDPTDAWIEEKVIFDSTKFVVREDAHYHYKTYCDNLGIIADDDKKFYARLRNTPRVKDCQIRVNGKPKRGFKGIELKPNNEFEEENPNNSIADYGSVADVTDVTAKTKSENPENNQNMESKTGVTPASSVTPEEADVGKYSQLVCVFCNKGIMDVKDWVQDGFTWNRPAHKVCYEQKQSELSQGLDKEAS